MLQAHSKQGGQQEQRAELSCATTGQLQAKLLVRVLCAAFAEEQACAPAAPVPSQRNRLTPNCLELVPRCDVVRSQTTNSSQPCDISMCPCAKSARIHIHSKQLTAPYNSARRRTAPLRTLWRTAPASRAAAVKADVPHHASLLHPSTQKAACIELRAPAGPAEPEDTRS